MQKNLSNLIFIFSLCLVITNCANRGTPSGGIKDIIPPKIIKSIPENYSTNFNGKDIKIYFDEYIKINNLQRQLIISPPMNTTPEVSPQGSASKYITIKIHDTLQPNTTYSFNFGNSIIDNNEENPYSYYKYVFSTGDYIDSLQVKGNIIDAIKQKPDPFISVRLYEIDSSFNDSVVYNKLPKYVTNTLDSVTTFNLENLKAGKYMLIAIKDANEDNKFQQKTDQIGFYKKFITVPSDSLYTIKLFKEENDFKVIRPRLVAGEKIAFGFQGDYKKTKINVKSNVPVDYKYAITKDEKTDSLNYWFEPRLKEVDSLIFKVNNKTYNEDFTVKISDQKRDSLIVKASPKGTIVFNEDFIISANIPFKEIDERKITILDKDSTNVEYSVVLDTLTNEYTFNFDKVEEGKYYFQALPEAFKDFFGNKNDTLNYTMRTKKISDYGDLRVTLKNAIYPIIVQLTNEKGEVKTERYSTKPEVIDFRHLNPENYYLRVIFDTNKNKYYDSGNYLKKIQPERVSYYPILIEEVRANWNPIIEVILD